MKIYKTIGVPATTKKVLIRRKCDLCGKESKTLDWDAETFNIEETQIKIEIKQRDGESYPEGGWGTEYEIDLCPDCFKNRFVQWLRQEGANIQENEWDW